MERNNKLPEKWYIKGCKELEIYFKSLYNKDYNVTNHQLYTNVDGIWKFIFGLRCADEYQEITLQQYLDSIKPNNNNTTKMKSIEIPEGYNLNLDKLIELGIVTKSSQETKKIAETYDEIIKDTDSSNIGCFTILDDNKHSNVDAFIKLLNTASYLNKIYEKEDNDKWYFLLEENELLNECIEFDQYVSTIYFNSNHAIHKALEILGEDTIKLALKFN